MSGSTGGAGPALAAHSKDASAPGQTPASEASGEVRSVPEAGEAAQRLLQRTADFVRAQPLVAMAAFIAAGMAVGKLRNRR
jgi:hypothetical protein